jgi:hypothetical protein
MTLPTFLLQHVDLDFGDEKIVKVAFLGPNAGLEKTHISLIAGANGTSKSRLLATLIGKLCEIEARDTKDAQFRRHLNSSYTDLICAGLSTLTNNFGYLEDEELIEKVGLPSGILALSNLVMDKFQFSRDTDADEPFYRYLGVRQGTNLTTTGSTERSVAEAVLHMASDDTRLNAFRDWLHLVFAKGRELAFSFPRLRRSDIDRFLDQPNRAAYIQERMERRYGSARSRNFSKSTVIETTEEISTLFEFLRSRLTEYSLPDSRGRLRTEEILRFSLLSESERWYLRTLIKNFSAASRAGFSAWPSLCIEGFPWIPFGSLSSGEQNLLSVGAKLIAYSRPGCLVVIDEPEVSLNVAWQQHYIELILKSLAHAPGSHVLIATHSPHLISSLPDNRASIVLAKKENDEVRFETIDAKFEGWGSEAILYQVLGISSASSFQLNRELAAVLKHIQRGGKDKRLLRSFIERFSKLEYQDKEPLGLVISEVRSYLTSIE